MNAYNDDLAYIHDAGFGHFAINAAATLVAELRRRKVGRGLVIDLGCGSGLLSAEVAAAGYKVLGIDLSPAMVALARARVPGGEFRVGSFLEAELPPCVAVCAVGEVLNYQFDPANTRRSLPRLLRHIHGALEPGGLLLFDVAGPGRAGGIGPRRSSFEGDDWAVLVTTEEDRRRGLLTRRITSFRKVGELYRREQEVHHLRLYGSAEMAAQLSAAGFRARLLRGYGPLRFPRGLAGFLAGKPSERRARVVA
jgi:SAM-dependent methyltransferase